MLLACKLIGCMRIEHMLVQPDPSRGYPAKFHEAVALADRAASTMRSVSSMIHDIALTLADSLEIKTLIVEADKLAEAALIPEHLLQMSVPRLPSDFMDVLCFVKHDDEVRVALEAVIMEIFTESASRKTRGKTRTRFCSAPPGCASATAK